jgi:hypothetical protein
LTGIIHCGARLGEERDDYAALTDVNFLSMDLQGAEGHCLRGATELLANLDYVKTEINKDEVYEVCAKVWELDEP